LDRLRRAARPAGGDGLSDAELLRRFVGRRDEAAFELLVWRHGPMVLGVCRRALRNPHDAEDAFQATFLLLARKAGGIARGEAVAPWLCRVALRVALRARAAAKRAGCAALPADVPAPEADRPAERDWLPILDEEINRLPERYRRPVVLCHLQGRTLAEAARQLGCRARLSRRGVVLSAGLAAALASHGTLSAALVRGTVRAALDYVLAGATSALSPSLLALTEGVLRAMFLSKMRFTAAVLLATALVGTGAGWVTYRAAADDAPAAGRPAPAAGAPAVPREAPQRRDDEERAARQRRDEQQARLERAEKLLNQAEKEVEERERLWLAELIDAQLKVMSLRENIKEKESELPAVGAGDQKKAEKAGVLAELRRLRRDLLVAEEELGALRRRQDWQRAKAQRNLDEQAERVRRWRQAVEEEPFPAAARPTADLERKLDQMLRELAELRRSLGRQEE
jgi:RNA polymerase sigma factor (sigma-70 family)